MENSIQDLHPGSVVLIAEFDDLPEHQFEIEEIYEDIVTGFALSGPLKGEYGEPPRELILRVIS
jgi:hypothetical protein